MMTPKLLTFGEAMIRLSPGDSQRVETTDSFEASVGGAELNVAVAASATGIVAEWISALPPSALASRVIRHARAHGVTPRLVTAMGRVGVYFVEVGPVPRGTSVHYDRKNSVFAGLTLESLDESAVIGECNYFYTSGITMALSPNLPAIVEEVLKRVTPAERWFEINYRSMLWPESDAAQATLRVLPHVDVLVASPQDLTGLLAIAEDVETAAKRLFDEYGMQMIVVPQRFGNVGEIGRNTLQVHTPSGVISGESEGFILDPVGAGDAGTGVLLGLLAQGVSIAEAVALSLRASALQQTFRGDAFIGSMGELRDSSSRRIRR